MTHEEILQAIAKIIGFTETDYQNLPNAVEEHCSAFYQDGYDDGQGDCDC